MPPFLWGLFIFVLTSLPNPPQAAVLPVWSDKVVHLALYAVLGALLVPALARVSSPAMRAFCAIGIVAVVGTVDEWHQQFIPGRAADVYDVYADITGGIIGSCFAIATFRREFRS